MTDLIAHQAAAYQRRKLYESLPEETLDALTQLRGYLIQHGEIDLYQFVRNAAVAAYVKGRDDARSI